MKYFTLLIFFIIIIKNYFVNGTSLKEKQCNYIDKMYKILGDENNSDCCNSIISECGENGEMKYLYVNK